MRFTLLIALALVPLASAQPVDKAELDKRLAARKVSFSGVPQPAAGLFDKIARVAEIDLILSQAAKTMLAETDYDKRFALPLKDARLVDALGMMLEVLDLRAVRFRGRLIVTTHDDASSYDKSETRLYRIADLGQEWRPEFEAHLPSLARLRSRIGSGTRFSTGEDTEPAITREALIEMIKSLVDPDSWEHEANSMDTVNGRLLVVNRPSAHVKIAALLARLRRLRSPKVAVEAWWVDARLVAGAGASMDLTAWRKRAGSARKYSLTGPVGRRLQLHDGPYNRLEFGERRVKLPTGVTLIVDARRAGSADVTRPPTRCRTAS